MLLGQRALAFTITEAVLRAWAGAFCISAY